MILDKRDLYFRPQGGTSHGYGNRLLAESRQLSWFFAILFLHYLAKRRNRQIHAAEC